MAKKAKRIAIPLIEDESGVSSRKKRNDLGLMLSEWVTACENSKGELVEKWRQGWEYLRNESIDTGDPTPNQSSDMTARPIPYVQPRVDTLCANMAGVILSQDPPMICDSGVDDSDVGDTLNRIGQLAWEEGGFKLSVAENCVNASITNKAIWRIAFNFKQAGMESQVGGTSRFSGGLEWCGVELDAISPDDFYIAPPEQKMQAATMVGRRFYMLASEIAERIKLEDYFDVPLAKKTRNQEGKEVLEIVGSDTSQDDDETGGVADSLTQPITFDSYPELAQIKLCELYVKLAPQPGALRQTYKAIIAPDHGSLLKFEIWPYSRTPFFAGKLKLDPSAKQFWEGRSVARDLGPLASAFNNDHTLFYNSAHATANPNLLTSQPLGVKNAFFSEGGGSIQEVDDSSGMPLEDQIWQPNIQFHGEALGNDIESLERYGDIVARTSTNQLGATDSKEVTATQTQAIAQGSSAGINDFIRWFTEPFPEMMTFTMELLSDPRHWRIWAPLWGFSDVPYDILQRRVRWTVAGSSVSDLPQIRFAMLGQLAKFSEDPSLGWDRRKLGKMILGASGLPGAQSIAMPDAEYEAQMQQQAAMNQQQGPQNKPSNGNDQGSGAMGGIPGMATSPQKTSAGSVLPGLPATNAGGHPHP